MPTFYLMERTRMFKKTIVGALVLLFIGCNAAKHDTPIHKEQRVPPYRVSSAEFISPSQPCPNDLCAIVDNPHVKDIHDTTYTCTTCEYIKTEVYVGGSDVVKSACPIGFVEINSNYCSHTDELCLYWVTIDGEKTNIATDRCGAFRAPVHCLVKPIHKHFCMAKYEGQNKKGELPRDWTSYNQAKKIAESDGNRLCTDSEWITAASGNEFLPLPYGDGYHRTHECNIDQHSHGVDIMHVSDPNSEGAGILRSHVMPSGSMDRCISSTGVMDLAGNLDETLTHESGVPYVSCLMGGFWGGVRNRSTAKTTSHSPDFTWYEESYRMCHDIITQ